jgi:hypothetical protein
MKAIYQQTRYYGPGLPPEGVADKDEAYRLGLRQARIDAIEEWVGDDGRPTAESIAEDYDGLVRAVADATDQFIAANGGMMFVPGKDRT